MTESATSLTDLTVDELLNTVADDSPTPGGGAVTAAATALAAALASMACRYAMRYQPDSVEFADMVVELDSLRHRSTELWSADAIAYRAYVEASRVNGLTVALLLRARWRASLSTSGRPARWTATSLRPSGGQFVSLFLTPSR